METGNQCFKTVSFSIHHAFIVYISYIGKRVFFFRNSIFSFLSFHKAESLPILLLMLLGDRWRNFNQNAWQKSKQQSHSAHPTLPVISLCYGIFRFPQVFLHIAKWLPHFTSRHDSFLLDAKQSPYFSKLC